ncbi:MAG: hypothetical protein AAGD22_16665 [Verrucomicrobiota bacterium]
MELHLSTAYHPVDPLPEDFGEVLREVTLADGGYFVLSEDETNYLQGTWSMVEKGFALEYQAGGLEAHYCFKEAMGVPLAVEIANLYRRGDLTWRTHPDWEHSPLDEAAEGGDDLVFLGNFDGVGLRRALSALEDQGIEFLIREQGANVLLYCSGEQGDAAKTLMAKLFPV